MAENDRPFSPENSSTRVATPNLPEINEETPLLDDQAKKSDATPLPKLQIAVLSFLQLSEPVTSQSIYPFINELVKSLDVTGGDERKVGYYAGLVESLFFASEALTVLYWSHLSDLIGRRPIVLMGFAGLSISMIGFGLSRTFFWLICSRCLAGLLNGNSGVIKSMIGELTDYSNMAQAFAFMPVVWSVGAAIGPFIGGQLSRPYERFPGTFWKLGVWETYPYLLPCAVAALFPASAFILTLILLKEQTVRNPNPTRHGESRSLSSNNKSTATSSPQTEGQSSLLRVEDESNASPSIRSILTRRVLVAILNYALLSFLDIAFLAVQPLFYATSISLGGLGLSPPTIGLCLGVYGLLMGSFQALFFAKFHDWLGSKKLLMFALSFNFPIFALFPVINLLARWYGMSFVTWATLGFQLFLCVFSDMSWGCAFIFVTISAPNKRSLGATNGLAATVSAAVRAIGPVTTTSLFAASIQHNLYHGMFVYGVLLFLVIVTLAAASLLPAKEAEWEDGESA
ncbi:MFS general substrate transporter [Phellopilus nigrolimitatus]|nr:MFS general substrate transporter [Phellopilus nigrolimitatus]